MWKSTGIRKRESLLLLSLARGQAVLQVRLPEPLQGLSPAAFLEMRLVWDKAGRHYQWHAVIEDGVVPDAANGVSLGPQANQKISNWSHGKVRSYIEYKAAAKGMVVELVNEAYTSQTCPNCGEWHKPKGRVYRCPACGFRSHRDAVGAANIRSVLVHGRPGKSPLGKVMYRHPHRIVGRRSRVDTAHVARL